MDQSIDRVLLVCNVDSTHTSEVNSVIERERKMGYLCVSQSVVPVPNTSPVQYTFSLGFSRSESCGNVGG